jgi:Kef-type K+ transport system membrane component KefB
VNKSLLFCPLVLVVFGLGLYGALERGRRLETLRAAGPVNPRAGTFLSAPSPSVGTQPPSAATERAALVQAPSVSLLADLDEKFREPLTRLFVQLILIVVAARFCGACAQRAGQPAVVGEMTAGILLGPSLLGRLAPGAFHFVFPSSSLGMLRVLSQIGVCLFMFIVGMDLDLGELRRQARTAVLVSQVSILFPYLLGMAASLFLFPTLAAAHTTFPAFALFIGISMSITAFPVLARILEERGLTRTPLGSTALACAAADDVTAWTVLAFVVAIAKAGSLAGSFFRLGLVLLFVGLMWLGVRPRLPRWLGHAALQRPGAWPSPHLEPSAPGGGVMAGVLVLLFASALATDVIGIHALFGAFLAGVIMPRRGTLREVLKERLEHFSSIFLLPVFFAFTGLRTQVGLLNDFNAWLVCLGLILLATVGKLGGATLTARLTGVNWADAFALGTLLNTRGLVELIALNIGYDLGILSPPMFTMLVIMALVTTGMTGPLLNLGDRFQTRKALALKPA